VAIHKRRGSIHILGCNARATRTVVAWETKIQSDTYH
jgi:hypothetical protein